ncbi:MAG: flippase [Pedobacter sp.]|nr:MAG: flippase [Pedobacter sp.]
MPELVRRIRLLGENKTIKKYVFNTSWLFSEQLIRMCVGLVVGVWVARYLGPEKFGILNYAQSLVALFSALATLGLNNIVIRELVKKNYDKNLLMGTSFIMKLIGGAVTFLFLFIAINIIPSDSYTKIVVLIVASSTIFQSFNVIDFYFQSKVESKFVVYVNILVLIVSTVLKVLFLLLKAPLVLFALLTVIENIVLAIGLIYFYKKNKETIKAWSFDKGICLMLLKDSWPLILSSISISIGMRIDQVMIKSYMNDVNVGYYAVGVKFAEIFTFIPMLISQSIYPKILEMDFNKERSKLIFMLRSIFYLLVLLSVGVNIFSSFAINLLYGVKYEDSISVVNILIWTIPFTYLNIVTSTILQKLNKSKTILFRQLLIAGINIVANTFLIPRFGTVGASLSTLIADTSLFFFGFFLYNERWIYLLRIESILFIPTKNIFKLKS